MNTINATHESIQQEAAHILLSINAVSFRFDPPFTYTSGLQSPIYLDNRLVMSHPKERTRIIELYIETIKQHIGIENVECVSGTATAAIPQAAWIADHLSVPMVFVRSSAKGHGKQRKLEGFFPKGAKVVIIEDHISTGGSALDNADTIREEGGIVDYCVATTTYETAAAHQAFEEKNVTIFALTTGKFIVEEAVKKGMLSKEQAESVHQWFENPTEWAGKQ